MKIKLRLIGDVHGYKERYLGLCRKSLNSIQLGDHGFDYSHLRTLDGSQHKILGGNHDNYDEVDNWPHFLGDFGLHCVGDFDPIFFVRGGFSIDRQFGIEGKSWWTDEELSTNLCCQALAYYEEIKPQFVISHECPTDMIPHVINSEMVIKTKTNQLLNQMFSVHQPKIWVFAHYHTSWRRVVDGTEFICLDELECMDF